MNILKFIGLAILIIMSSLFLVLVVKLIQIKQSVRIYENYWSENNSQPISSEDLLYVAMGNSAAQGIGASSPEKGYVGLVAAALAKKTGKNVRIINLSVTGAKVQDLIDKQLPKLQSLPVNNQTVVTVEIGANDMGSFESDRFKQNFETIMQQLPSQSIVADIPYFGGGRYQEHEDSAQSASNIIYELAGKYNLQMAPLHEITKEKDSFFVNAADWFHPNDRGYHNWAEAFLRTMGG